MAQDVHVLAFDLLTNTLVGEIPLSNLTFSNKLNGGGQLSGVIPLKDSRNRNLDPYTSTQPGRTILVVIVNGTIRWQGMVQSRSYVTTSGDLTVSGVELEGYLAKLQQTRDYSSHPHGFRNVGYGGSSTSLTYTSSAKIWVTNPVPPVVAAMKVIGDALSDLYTAYSSISVLGVASSSILNSAVKSHFVGAYPSINYHTAEKLPISNRATLDSMLNTLSMQHITAGFDWHWSSALSGTSSLTYSLDFYWPRMGFDCTGGSGGSLGTNTNGIAAIDSQDIIDYTYSEDSSQQSTRVFALSGGVKGYRLGIGDVSYGFTTSSKMFMDTSPPPGTAFTFNIGGTAYTATVKHITPEGPFGFYWKMTGWSPSTPTFTAGQQVQAMITGGPTSAGYPPMQKSSTYTHVKTAAALQNQAFSELAQLQWPVSTNSITCDAFGQSGFGAFSVGDDIRVIQNPDERFVLGVDAFWRVVQADWTINDYGLSTVVYSLDMPPSSNQTTGGFPGFRPPYQ